MRRRCVLTILAIGALALIAEVNAQDAPCGTLTSRGVPMEALATPASAAWSDEAPDGPYYYPVAFHVVRRTNGSGGVDPSKFQFTIQSLNTAWAASDLRFYAVGPVDFINDDDFYNIEYAEGDLTELYSLWQTNNRPDAIDIYCVSSIVKTDDPPLQQEKGGLASYPWSSAAQGVLLTTDSITGSTGPHELGHYFGLLHTHETQFAGVEKLDGSNCQTAGDLICDTPADPTLGAHNVDSATCSYTGAQIPPPLANNIMSYSWSFCRDDFTPMQEERAEAFALQDRADMIHPAWPGLGDCDQNGIVDSHEIATGSAADANGNGILDSCENPLVVRVAASGGLPTGSGTSWQDPYPGLQAALNLCDYVTEMPVELWLREGVYKPTGGSGDRWCSFVLRDGVAILGGFDGTETVSAERDPQQHVVTLSGDLLGNDGPVPASTLDNSHRVVQGVDLGSSCVLDGLSITGGTGLESLSDPDAGGAGIHLEDSDVAMIDCVIEGNAAYVEVQGGHAWYGGMAGGLAALRGSPTLDGCTIVGNRGAKAGGVFLLDSHAVLTDCTFEDNGVGVGVALTIEESGAVPDALVQVTGCRFVRNGESAGGVDCGNTILSVGRSVFTDCVMANNIVLTNPGFRAALHSASLVGCTVTGNRSVSPLLEYAAIEGSWDVEITDSIIWGNTSDLSTGASPQLAEIQTGAVDYSCVEGWDGSLGGVGNTGLPPYFHDPAQEDWRLAHGSPLVDLGDPSSPLDPDGTRADMGALPFDPLLPSPWIDLGYALAGTGGPPAIIGRGSALVGSRVAIELIDALPFAQTNLLMSVLDPPVPAPFKGGMLVAFPPLPNTPIPLPVDAYGRALVPLDDTWDGLQPGVKFVFQFWTIDSGGPQGLSASNGVQLDDG